MAEENENIAVLSVNAEIGGTSDVQQNTEALLDNVDAAERAAAAQDALSVSSEKVAAANARTSAVYQRVGSDLGNLQQQLARAQTFLTDGAAKLQTNTDINPSNAAVNTQAIAGLRAKVDQLKLSVAAAGAGMANAGTIFTTQADVIGRLTGAMDSYEAALISTGAAQRTVNGILAQSGLDPSKFTIATEQINATAAALGNLARSISPVAAAAATYEQAMGRILAADKAGIASADELMAARLSANEALTAGVRASTPQYIVPTRSQSLSISGAPQEDVIAAIKEENAAMAALQGEIDRTTAAYTRLFDEGDAKMAALAASNAAAAAQAKAVAESTDALDSVYAELADRFSGVSQATKTYQAALADISTAQSLQILDANALSEALIKVTEAYEAAGGAVYSVASRPPDYLTPGVRASVSSGNAAAAQQGRDALYARGGTSQIQDLINQSTGVTGTSAAESGATFDALGQRMDAVLAKYDPLIAAQQKYDAAIRQIDADEAFAGGPTDGTRAARAQASAALAEQSTSDAQKSAAASAEALDDTIARLTDRFSAISPAAKQYLDTLEDIRAAQALGVLSADGASAATDRASATLSSSAGGNLYTVPTQAQAAPGQAAAAAQAQALADKLDQVKAKYDPLYAAQLAYDNELRKIAEDEALLGGATAGTNQARSNAEASLARETAAIKNASDAGLQHSASLGQQQFAQRQLTVQTTQFFSQIASGQPFFTALVQQGHQVLDVAESTGTGLEAVSGAFSSMAAKIMSPVGIVAVFAIAAAGLAYWGVEADAASTKAERLANALSLTHANSQALGAGITKAAADFVTATPGVGLNEAQQAAQSLASSPNFAGSAADMQSYLAVSQKLAQAMGEDLPAAAKTLSSAMKDPTAAAKQAFDDGFKGFNAGLLQSITNMQAAGDRAGAFQGYLTGLNATLADVHSTTTPLQSALHDLSNAFHAAGSDGKSLADSFGDVLAREVTFAIGQLTDIINKVEGFREWLGQVGSPAQIRSSDGLAATATKSNLDPDFVGRLQQNEGKIGPDGQWETSPTGAVGMMQVLPSLFYGEKDKPGTGIVNQPQQYPLTAAAITANGGKADLSNPAINMTAGAEQFSKELQKYGDPFTAVMAYHDGDPLMDKILGIQQSNPNADLSTALSPKEYSQYLAGRDEAQKVTAGYTGTGWAAGYSPAAGTIPMRSTAADNTRSDAIDPGLLAQAQAAVHDQQAAILAAVQAGSGTLPAQRQDLTDQITANRTARANTTDPQQIQVLDAAYVKLESDLNNAVDAQTKLAQASTAALPAQTALTGAAKAYAEVQEQFAAAAKENNDGVVNQTALSTALANKQQELSAQFNQGVSAINQETSAIEAQALATGVSAAAIQHEIDLQQALKDAKETADPSTQSDLYVKQVEEETAALDAKAAALVDLANKQKLVDGQAGLSRTNYEASIATEPAGQRATDLAAYDARASLTKQGADQNSPTSQAVISVAVDQAAADTNLKEIQDNIAAVGDVGDKVFSDLGQSISNAFTSGNAAALNFHSIVSGLLGDLLAQLTKLALINPLENWVSGNDAPTLTGMIQALSGASSGGSGSGSGGVGSLLSMFGMGGSGSGSGWNSSGWVDVGGAAGASGSSGSLLGSSIGFGGINIPTSGWGGALSGIGLGTLGGGLLGKLEGGNSNNSSLGSTAGSLAGAAIGSVIPVVGTLLGGVLGGVLGGGIGGLFGGATQHNGWNIKLGTENGQLGITNSGFEGTSKDTSQQLLDQTAYQVAQVNQLLTEYHAQVGGAAVFGGDNGANGGNLPGQATTFEEAMGQLVYSSTDAIIEKALQTYGATGALNSINNLATVLSNAKSLSDSVGNLSDPLGTSGAGNFLTTNLTGMGGSIASTLASLWQNTYAPQLNEANVIGDTATYNKLLAGFNSISSYLQAQASEQVQQTDYGYTAAAQTANGQTFAAQDTQQTASADQQRSALKNELDGLYGTAYESTSDYAAQMAQLDQTIGAQAAALQRQQAQQDTTDIIGVQSGDLSEYGRIATSYGQTDYAANLNLQSSQMTEMNEAVIKFTALLQNGEINQQTYNNQIALLSQTQAAESAALQRQQAEADKQSLDQFSENTLTFSARYITATGGDPEQAALDNFDASASSQVDQLQTQLETMLNNGIISTSDYYAQITQLDQTLAQERLAVQQQYVDQANSQLTSQVGGLESFIQGLQSQIGTPQDQYNANKATYEADLAGAQNGNATDFQNLQSAAQAFLSSSSSVNGTGNLYYQDVSSVIAAIQNITGSQANLDALTASTMSQIAETQTEKYVDAINQLKAVMVQVQLQLRQAVLAG